MAKINAKNTAQNKLKQGTILDFLGVAKGSGVQKPKVAYVFLGRQLALSIFSLAFFPCLESSFAQ